MDRITGRAHGHASIRKGGITDAMDRLAEYEDLEETGLLLRLPCRVGDTLYSYSTHPPHVWPLVVKQVSINEHGHWLVYAGTCVLNFDDFGINVFTSKEEAQKAQKDRLSKQG